MDQLLSFAYAQEKVDLGTDFLLFTFNDGMSMNIEEGKANQHTYISRDQLFKQRIETMQKAVLKSLRKQGEIDQKYV